VSDTSLARPVPRMAPLAGRSWPWVALLLLALAGAVFRDQLGILADPPQAIANFEKLLSDNWKAVVETPLLSLFSIKDFTRGVIGLINYPMQFLQSVLAPEFQRPQWLPKAFPSLPWITIAGLAAIAGHYAGGRRTALMLFAACVYFAVFGMWNSTMLTLASISVAVPLGLIIGTLLGVWCFKSQNARSVILPVLDLMQTVPFFSYMMPIVTLFGMSPLSALIATLIFAIPPMVRVTELSLRQVPAEVVDFGAMAGCKPWQLMWLVRLPAARDNLLIGLNQVVMLTLNLVILASVIGARGLGFDVWNALNRLNIGKGLEYGMAIVILAVVLDRYLRRLAVRRPTERSASPLFHHRHPYWTAALAFLVVSWLAALLVPALAIWPKEYFISTSAFWNGLMTWINVNFFDAIAVLRDFLVIYILNQIRNLLQLIPWTVAVAALALLGWQLRSWKLATLVGGLALAIAFAGLWDKAVLTIYECGAAVLFCVALGFPLGIWAARSERVWRVIEPLADLLQTIPSFIFLIPFVILFRTGEFTAILIVISFAIVPAIRYTAEGIRSVPPHLVEAARMQGCNPWQVLTQVQLPLAFPRILLGLNQTILMALSMLVITAYAGTNDLGQDSLAGVMNRNLGRSVMAGLAIAAIAVITDRLITAKAMQVAKRMGLQIA
jgi:glycine betaine/proline transport system permease protein